MRRFGFVLFGIAAAIAGASALFGEGRPNPAAIVAAQREAMTRFARMDGVWRGDAWTLTPSGEKHDLTQTERVGPFLDGTLRVIEGRGYEGDGTVGFHAFAVLSYDPATNTYSMRSYVQGRTGDFPVIPTDDGFRWEIPAGPATIRYTATIGEGTWKEFGDRIVPGREPVRFFEMTLTRRGDTDWPEAGAAGPK